MSEREQIASIFERVSTHLLTQMVKSSMGDHGMCYYRKPLGDGTFLMCAVGCLIPDELYDPEMEYYGIFSLAIDGARWMIEERDHLEERNQGLSTLARVMNESGIPATVKIARLLMRLQHIHDWYSPITWHQRLTDLASELGLPPPMPPSAGQMAD